MCLDCQRGIEPGAKACACGWKVPPKHHAPKMPAAVEPPVVAIVRSAEELERMKATVRRMMSPQDPKAWARRILDSAARGEKVSPIQFESATKALGCVAQQPIEREPGADDDAVAA